LRTFLGQPDAEDLSILLLTGPEARHACKVARLKPGNHALVMANNQLHECSVITISPSLARLAIVSVRPTAADKAPRIILAQGIAKGQAMDDIVRITSELGVAGIIPLLSSRVEGAGEEKRLQNRMERWRAIALSAAKVSGEASPCAILAPMKLAQLAEVEAQLRIAFWEEESATIKTILQGVEVVSSALIVIGPEGGFSKDEVDLLRSMGMKTASLGKRILRARTAGAAAILALQYHFGD